MSQIESLHIEGRDTYKEILQVNAPVRFYWNTDGTFDGIEIGEFKEKLTEWERQMLDDILNAIKPSMGVHKSEVEDEE